MRHRLRNYLIAGVLVMLPVAVTVFVLRAVFRLLDSLLAPLFSAFGIHIPGLGLVSGVALILVAGAMASNVVGHRLVRGFDGLMLRIPFARTIYSATKQLSDTLLHQNRLALREAVLVEWPGKGLYTVGFVTGESRGEIRDAVGERVVNIFIMTTPNPTTGFVCMVPESQVRRLQMSVEDALKLVVSGGIVTPGARVDGVVTAGAERFE
jgi:uncharacterized membrane protein